ncbi:MAG: hypothetical protein ABS75_10720 [Pelagibacterium sp. SCN 63-23]|nr:MAG: hypothetical protein ABS75_10720 [Pelagibacterium sp. SCN 63-23]
MKSIAVAALITALVCAPALAQAPIPTLKPEGWSELDAAAARVAYWVNGARLCNINYDPVALEARIAETAAMHGVSVAAVKRAAIPWADRFAPHVTSTTCRQANQQAKRLGTLAGYKPPPPSTPTAQSLVE